MKYPVEVSQLQKEDKKLPIYIYSNKEKIKLFYIVFRIKNKNKDKCRKKFRCEILDKTFFNFFENKNDLLRKFEEEIKSEMQEEIEKIIKNIFKTKEQNNVRFTKYN